MEMEVQLPISLHIHLIQGVHLRMQAAKHQQDRTKVAVEAGDAGDEAEDLEQREVLW